MLNNFNVSNQNEQTNKIIFPLIIMFFNKYQYMGAQVSRGKEFSYSQKYNGIRYILVCYANSDIISFFITPSTHQTLNYNYKNTKSQKNQITEKLFPTHIQLYQELEKAKENKKFDLKQNSFKFQIINGDKMRKGQILLNGTKQLYLIERCFLTGNKQLKAKLENQDKQTKINLLTKQIQNLNKQNSAQKQAHQSQLAKMEQKLSEVNTKLSEQFVRNELMLEQNKSLNKMKKRMSTLISSTISPSKITSNGLSSDEEVEQYDEDQKEQQRITKYPNLQYKNRSFK